MEGVLAIDVNASEIGKGLMSNFPLELSSSLQFFIHILEALGVVVLVYVIILIIKAVFAMKTNARIKKISENVEEINNKLDSLVRKKNSKK